MKALYDVCAPAKLNLFLHVTGRRADGFHSLQSAFMLIDWCDTLHFERRGDGQISREDLPSGRGLAGDQPGDTPGAAVGAGANAVLPSADLTVRAAQALRAAAGASAAALGVHIGLVKRIPSQAGMGGGSSDAASTLLALNRLWQLNVPLSQLLEIGLKLGADVPFFLLGGNSWVEGIGEIITPIELPAAQFLVAKPPAGLETARIFSHPGLERNTATAIILGFAANPFEFGRNDLQAVAEQLCPGVGQGLNWLAQHGLQGRMTGSGSAVFAPMPALATRMAPSGGGLVAAASLDAASFDAATLLASKPAGFDARVCNNLAAHPLAGWADV